MATRIKIGDQAYLWMPGAQSSIAVVSCHGGVLPKTFVMPPGSVFKFYSLPTKSAYGSLEKTLYDDQVKETKIANHAKQSWNVIDDYDLSKFQGKHGGNSESYDDVRRFVDEHSQNVLTLRNRKSVFADKSEQNRTLSFLVTQLSIRFPHITEYRCLFCRVDDHAWVDVLTGQKYTG